eukprot:CAMPEP_0184292036 /NCGR_PEP_ID=MMETSP1049-20130417/3897_1 /TAXON_ID=77928 /ORGANISM="Proteomonas sulcata, Strain CCMP704" /LENGTH=52 /DNA_ID=CAMNT_0026599663 /DNA_START=289 /DNA_END=443 /DNA_ORIENTATION=+
MNPSPGIARKHSGVEQVIVRSDQFQMAYSKSKKKQSWNPIRWCIESGCTIAA